MKKSGGTRRIEETYKFPEQLAKKIETKKKRSDDFAKAQRDSNPIKLFWGRMMDLEYDITVKLTPEQIQKILADHVELKMGGKFKVTTVDLKVEKEYRGIGPAETEVSVFKGATVSAEIDNDPRRVSIP